MQRLLSPAEAKRINVYWPYSVGKRSNANAGRELITITPALSKKPIEAIQIRRLFNLGNHIRQVVNAVRFAEIHGIDCVILPLGSIFGEGMVAGVRVVPVSRHENQTRSLVGDFFYYEDLGISEANLDRGRILQEMRALVPPLSAALTPTKVITIHLRAGDVFSKRPHPLYSPPPLSFFTAAIERSAATAVRIVAQDDAHPYATKLRAYCTERSLPLSFHSSSLSEDFDMLRDSENLCISQGTLGLGAAWLSPRCQNLFAFGRDGSDIATTKDLGISTHVAEADLPFTTWTGNPLEIDALSSLDPKNLRWK